MASLKTMSVQELDQQITALSNQMQDIQRQIDNTSSERVHEGLRRNLERVRAAGLEAIKLRNDLLRQAETPPLIADPADTGGLSAEEKTAAENRIQAVWDHLNNWMRSPEHARALTMVTPVRSGVQLSEEGLEKMREAERRRQEFLSAGGSLEEVSAHGAVRDMSAEAIRMLEREVEMYENLDAVAEQVAYNIAYSFQSAFELMRSEGATSGNVMKGVLRGIAGAGLASISKLAQAKVKENVAAAIEASARALGFLAIGNFPSQAAALAAAGKHALAAAAWGIAAGGAGAAAGAVHGGGGAVPAATRDGGISQAQRTEAPPTQINVFFDPLDPRDPRAQTFVGEATRQLGEIDGGNVDIQWFPASAAAGRRTRG